MRATMQGNRKRDTGPERALRSALFARALRYRVDHPIRVAPGVRPIRADIVFTRPKLAVFVDGCFWHGCPEHGTRPTRNSHYWDAKLQRNVERDRRYEQLLAGAGWTVIRVWEHEDVEPAADRIAACLTELTRRRPPAPPAAASPPASPPPPP